MLPMMKVFTLGGLKILLGDEPVIHLGSRKAAALIVYLIGTGRPQAREVLADLLWDDRSQSQALANLRGVLALLRKHFDPYFLLTRETVALNPDAEIWSDVVKFDAGLRAIHRAGPLAEASASEQAGRLVDLYQGEFLQGFYLRQSQRFDAWMLPERERLHQLALNTLSDLVAYYLENGDHQAGIARAARLLELDPLMESAHRQMMHLLALSGKRALAMKQYETLQGTLDRELDIEPEPESQQLYEDIRAGRLSGDVTKPVTITPSETRPRHNLAPSLTPLIGRESDLEKVAALLQDPTCRLVTLVGPGGIGKTRLAIQAARDLLPTFAHGAWFVWLESLSSPNFLAEAIATALGLPLSEGLTPAEQLLESLRRKDILLLLDNFEHLLPKGTELLIDILRAAPGAKLLITSRQMLNLQAESLYPVHGLDFPIDGSDEPAEAYPAGSLFSQLARRASGYTLASADMPCVAHIAWLVEGSPLALELAATWTRALSCPEIAREIERGLGFLQANQPDLPERHRSLRAVFDHSWKLLSEEERAVFRKLSVFRGGFDREAARQVAHASLTTLKDLVDKSLIYHLPGGRYRIHNLLRQFSAEQLEHAGESGDTRERHLAYFLQFTERAEPELWRDQEKIWLDRLEAEHHNLRQALAQSLSPVSALGVRSGMRLIAATEQFLWRRAYLTEAARWLADLMAHPHASEHPKEFANSLRFAARLNDLVFVKLEDARGQFERSLALAEQAGDALILARVLSDFGAFLTGSDQNAFGVFLIGSEKYLDRAESYLERSLALYRELDYQPGAANVLIRIGHLAERRHNQLAARSYFQESLQVSRMLGNRSGIASGLYELGINSARTGQLAEARDFFEESLALYRDLNDNYVAPSLLFQLGWLAFNAGEINRAAGYFEEMLAVYRNSGRKRALPAVLCSLGVVASIQEHYAKSLTYYREALAIAQEMGDQSLPIWVSLAKGYYFFRQGDGMSAFQLFEESLLLSREINSLSYGAMALIGLAGLSASRERPQRAARLLGNADGMFELIDMSLRYAPAVYPQYQRIKAQIQKQLDQATFTQLLEEGRAMAANGFDHIIAFALDKS